MSPAPSVRARPAPRKAPARSRPKRPASLLSLGNTKLGPSLIWTFSLPAIATCPGSSAACRRACYATRGHYASPSVYRRYEANQAASLQPEFVDDICAEIRRWRVQVVRVHGSGDFYSADYATRWLRIFEACPRTTFYFYTRSWSDPAIREVLTAAAALPNAHAWYSADAETGAPPETAGVRRAFMLARGEAEATAPAWADLVFRVSHSRPAKRANGILICPYEQGVARKREIHCETCKICFSPYPLSQKES